MILTFHLWTNRCNNCERAARTYYSLAAVYKILFLQSVAILVVWHRGWRDILQGQQAFQQIVTVILGEEMNVESGGAVPCKVAWAPTAAAHERSLPGTLGINVHGDTRGYGALLEGVWWRPWGLGRGRHRCRLWGGVSREGARGKAGHSCRCCSMAPDSGGVKSFVCEVVLVESSRSGIPLVRGVIWRAVSARFHDLVLEDWIKTASELQDNCEVV